jgi:hypothetical protein
MNETWMPRCVRLNKLNQAKLMNDEKILNEITSEISPGGRLTEKEQSTALLSYIALGGSLLSLGSIFYLYFNGEPVSPECMNDNTYNTIVETCNKLFTTYWKNEDKTSCEIEMENFNAANAAYYERLTMLTGTFLSTSVYLGASKIGQIASWVKNKLKLSSCSVQGGRRRYRKTRKHTKKSKSRRHIKKRRTHRR